MARVLVLGGYGLIGSNVARALAARGHEVVALGRDRAAARRVLPAFTWVIRDMRDLVTQKAWAPIVEDIDFVVNCAGALQANARDDLEAVHLRSIGALVLACEKVGAGIVQISAVGAEPGARLAFHRTKAEGDGLIRESPVPWWIFRPGLVIAPSSYGGTTLIRILAGVPMVQPIALPRAEIQTVAVTDVARAVTRAIEGKTPPGLVADLVEAEAHPVADIVAATRRWLGFPAAKATVVIPRLGLRAASLVSDLLGRLGWRVPLRSTAMAAIARGVTGDPRETERALGRPALTLPETLKSLPARVEDRLFARTQLLSPLLLAALATSWTWKGLNGLNAMDQIVADVAVNGIPEEITRVVATVLSTLGIVLGLSVLVRRWADRALVLMAFVAIFYGGALTLMAPQMWLDPFGAGANLFLIIFGSLAARVMMDTR